MRAVFLDRDGVINEIRDDYVTSPAEFRLLPGALEALTALAASPYHVVVSTNQAAVGRGRMTQAALDEVHGELLRRVGEVHGRIDAIYACPHHPADGCGCRKPRPGLLRQAARDLSLDLAQSFFVGDAVSDVEAARSAGCQPILVLTGHGRTSLAALGERLRQQVWIARDLADAVALILAGPDRPSYTGAALPASRTCPVAVPSTPKARS